MGKSKQKDLLNNFVRKPLKSIESLKLQRYIQPESRQLFSRYDQRRISNNALHNKNNLSESLPTLREYINSTCELLGSTSNILDRHELLKITIEELEKYNILKHLNNAFDSLMLNDTIKKAIKYTHGDTDIYSSLKIYRKECQDLANEIINFRVEYAGLEARLPAKPQLGK